jgi:hypothetical protein
LDRNPAVAIPPESHFIPRLWRNRRRYGRNGIIEDRDTFLRDLACEKRFRDWELPVGEIQRAMGESAIGFASAIDAIYRAYARREGKEGWADKTPGYIYHAFLIARLFPDARFVHLVRDGRDVALSVLDVGTRHGHAATVAMSWRRTMRTGRVARDLIGVNRWINVRYEDLVATPETVLRSVCSLIGMTFGPEMLRTSGGASRVPATRRAWHEHLDLPVTAGLRDWRTQMPAREISEFEAIAESELARNGYAPSGIRRSRYTTASAWARVAAFPLVDRRRPRRLLPLPRQVSAR